MLHPRIIPCLLVHKKGLYKTVQFKNHKYVGDPINAVRIFNEKEVDELIVLDIDATTLGNEPDYKMIENLAAECRMPLCYGGGIKNRAQGERIFGLGVEKIALSSLAGENPAMVTEIAERVGNQSVVVIMDVKKNALRGGYEICTHNSAKPTGINPVDFAITMEKAGAGELVINSIDQDGMMQGYDMQLIQKVRDVISLPMTVLGGCGSLEDIRELIQRYGIIGAAVGSLFVFKGKFRAVLINYPAQTEKMMLLQSFLKTTDSFGASDKGKRI